MPERTKLVFRKLNRWRLVLSLEAKAKSSRRRLLIKYSLFKWNKNQLYNLQLQANYENAISHYELSLARNKFHTWRYEVVKSKTLFNLLASFDIKNKERKIRVALKAWREKTNRTIDTNYLLSIAFSNNLDARFLLRLYLFCLITTQFYYIDGLS